MGEDSREENDERGGGGRTGGEEGWIGTPIPVLLFGLKELGLAIKVPQSWVVGSSWKAPPLAYCSCRW